MNYSVILIEAIIMMVLFSAMIIIPLVKNPVWWIADYPEEIQEEYFKTHERVPSKFFTPSVLAKKGMAILICIAFIFLDWVLFANLKAVRLPGTEHMDKAYHNKKYHFIQSCWGMLIGFIPCVIASGIYEWIIS